MSNRDHQHANHNFDRWRDDATGELPAWLKPHLGEPRWTVALTLVIAIVLQIFLPDALVLRPRTGAPILEGALLIALIVANPGRVTANAAGWLRPASLLLLSVLTATNSLSTVLLIHRILTDPHVEPTRLLASGASIWLTNVIVFSLWYWEFDRGGPLSRATASEHTPDFLFPQMTDPRYDPTFHPTYFDYLYVSFTNSTAFSPTDTMPMSRWAKALMMIQSFISVVVVAMVAARAVNILPS